MFKKHVSNKIQLFVPIFGSEETLKLQQLKPGLEKASPAYLESREKKDL